MHGCNSEAWAHGPWVTLCPRVPRPPTLNHHHPTITTTPQSFADYGHNSVVVPELLAAVGLQVRFVGFASVPVVSAESTS